MMEELCTRLQDTEDVLLSSGGNQFPPINKECLIRSNSVMDDREYAKREIQRVTIHANVPSMQLTDSGSKSGTTFNSAMHAHFKASNPSPYFSYKHEEGALRNLPGHADIIRLLAELSKDNSTGKKKDEGAIDNSWLALYTTERPRQNGGTRVRKSVHTPVCSFCQEKGGKHKKWCVHFVSKPVEDPYSSMKRSKTDISEFFKRPKRVKPLLVETPPTPYKRFPLRPADYPDYTDLHREVYEHALAVTRSTLDKRLAKKKNFVLERQLTDPFIFSYMNRYGKTNSQSVEDGMIHIFGKKNVDFTRHYEYSVKKVKGKKKKAIQK